jgi:ectoine hydroxylase-related dioxygenase (phytanoyl-CoA dioxygenase family)
MQHNSPEFITSLLDKVEGEKFDKDIFDKAGVFVVRNALPKNLVEEWRKEWDIFYEEKLANGRNVNVNNPVDLKEELPPTLAKIYKNDILLDYVQKVFGENIALYNHRFVIKDRFSRGEIFLHQDFCYHVGMPSKASFFVPLSYAGKTNGGLTYYLGTHKYGFLGDAGEINPEQFNEKWPQYTPELQPGDFAIMNSLIWHTSGVNEAGIDRIVADIIYQPANDPSGKELLRGKWQTDFFIDRNRNPKDFFKWSRVTRLVELNEKINKSNNQ